MEAKNTDADGAGSRTVKSTAAGATESADIEALAVFPDLRHAYDERLIDPHHIGRSELSDVEMSPRGGLLEA